MLFRFFFLIFAAVFFCVSSAFACNLQPEGLKPAFDTAAPGVTVLSAPAREGNDQAGHSLKESIRLDNGIVITYDVGGCEHFGYGLKYENVPGLKKGAPKTEAIARGRELLEKTPLLSNTTVDREAFLGGLDQLQRGAGDPAERDVYTLPCGHDPTCDLSVPADGVLEFSYDFPM